MNAPAGWWWASSPASTAVAALPGWPVSPDWTAIPSPAGDGNCAGRSPGRVRFVGLVRGASASKKTRVANLAGRPTPPASVGRRPGRGGNAAVAAALPGVFPTPRASAATGPHTPPATGGPPQAATASPTPTPRVPNPSRPDPATRADDPWPAGTDSDGSRPSAPERCSSAAGPPLRSTQTAPASNSWSPSRSSATTRGPRPPGLGQPPDASDSKTVTAAAAPPGR